jgi:hypothetical protein
VPPSRIGPPPISQPTNNAATVKAWAREALRIGDDTTILLSELACTEPGCPPVETVVAVFAATTTKVTIHKPLHEITQTDIHAALAAPT